MRSGAGLGAAVVPASKVGGVGDFVLARGRWGRGISEYSESLSRSPNSVLEFIIADELGECVCLFNNPDCSMLSCQLHGRDAVHRWGGALLAQAGRTVRPASP